jgi:DNA replication protein DnaC
LGEVVRIEKEEEAGEKIDFDDFWLLYPRRVAKKDARKAWDRLTPSNQLAALVAIASWRSIYLAREPDRIPHAATWLNGERWEDELPQSMHASHVPAEVPAAGPKSAMPESVRALIARLRK